MVKLLSVGCMVVKIGVQKSESLDPAIYNPLYDPAKNEGSSLSVPKSMLTDGSDGCVHFKQFVYCKTAALI